MGRATPVRVTLDIRVIPRARRTELAGTRQGALLIRLAAPPVDGAANDALQRFLAELLDVPLKAVRIVSGISGRAKRVAIDGRTAEDIRAKLSPS